MGDTFTQFFTAVVGGQKIKKLANASVCVIQEQISHLIIIYQEEKGDRRSRELSEKFIWEPSRSPSPLVLGPAMDRV